MSTSIESVAEDEFTMMTQELDWDAHFDQKSTKENMSQIKQEIINNNFDERLENGISIYKFGWVDDNRYVQLLMLYKKLIINLLQSQRTRRRSN